MKFIDLTGHKYGKLTVIEKADHTPSGTIRWLCKCDCGNLTKVAGNNLKRLNPRYATKSCGCLNTYPKGEASFRSLYRYYKTNAEKRNYKFELSEKEFRNLVNDSCFYCGIKPSQIVRRPQNNGDFIYNGIDRVDNNKGYITNNCVACCGICNNMKKVLTQKDFISQVLCISDYVRTKELTDNERKKNDE